MREQKWDQAETFSSASVAPAVVGKLRNLIWREGGGGGEGAVSGNEDDEEEEEEER